MRFKSKHSKMTVEGEKRQLDMETDRRQPLRSLPAGTVILNTVKNLVA
ncbi:hypothetical protein [Dialister succinatiphilus]|nr:hypothetical protein [Dialister succinatiphilus]